MRNFFKKLRSDSWSKYFSKTVQRVGKNNAGFSLVELIVVIAIMAVLAAVAVIGVSIYIPKAQKQADQTMVTDLIDGIDMMATMNPDSIPNGATIFLSSGNAYIANDNDGKLAALLTDMYGSDYASKLKLQYDQWALGGIVTNHANQLLTDLNGKELSYQDDVDDLWGEVEQILTTLQGADKIQGCLAVTLL